MASPLAEDTDFVSVLGLQLMSIFMIKSSAHCFD